MWEGPLCPDWSPHKGASHIGASHGAAAAEEQQAGTPVGRTAETAVLRFPPRQLLHCSVAASELGKGHRR